MLKHLPNSYNLYLHPASVSGIIVLTLCVCVFTTLSTECTDIQTWNSACRSNGRISRSNLKVKDNRSKRLRGVIFWPDNKDRWSYTVITRKTYCIHSKISAYAYIQRKLNIVRLFSTYAYFYIVGAYLWRKYDSKAHMRLFLRCAYFWGALIYGCVQYAFMSVWDQLKGIGG